MSVPDVRADVPCRPWLTAQSRTWTGRVRLRQQLLSRTRHQASLVTTLRFVLARGEDTNPDHCQPMLRSRSIAGPQPWLKMRRTLLRKLKLVSYILLSGGSCETKRARPESYMLPLQAAAALNI